MFNASTGGYATNYKFNLEKSTIYKYFTKIIIIINSHLFKIINKIKKKKEKKESMYKNEENEREKKEKMNSSK